MTQSVLFQEKPRRTMLNSRRPITGVCPITGLHGWRCPFTGWFAPYSYVYERVRAALEAQAA